MSSGSLNVVHESNASGPLNADVLADTNNVLVDTAMFHAVSFEPQAIQVSLSAVLSCYLATLLHGMLGYEVCGMNVLPWAVCCLSPLETKGASQPCLRAFL